MAAIDHYENLVIGCQCRDGDHRPQLTMFMRRAGRQSVTRHLSTRRTGGLRFANPPYGHHPSMCERHRADQFVFETQGGYTFFAITLFHGSTIGVK
jgi:hypothetical protein